MKRERFAELMQNLMKLAQRGLLTAVVSPTEDVPESSLRATAKVLTFYAILMHPNIVPVIEEIIDDTEKVLEKNKEESPI